MSKLNFFAALALTVSASQWVMPSATLAYGFADDMLEAGLSGGNLTGGSSRLLDPKLEVFPVIGLMPFLRSQLSVIRRRDNHYRNNESEQATPPLVRDIEAIVIRS